MRTDGLRADPSRRLPLVLFADLLVRYLRYRGLRVTWVMNITDIDDKIIKGAAATGEPFGVLTERFIGRFLEDAAAMRMTSPDAMPRPTGHIPEIVRLIGRLLDAVLDGADRNRVV